jgi:hypothetical protein
MPLAPVPPSGTMTLATADVVLETDRILTVPVMEPDEYSRTIFAVPDV